MVPVDLIDYNQWNANKMPAARYRRLVEQIKKKGMLSAVLLREQGSRFLCIDGEHRVMAAKDASLTEIPAVVIQQDLPKHQMIELTLLMNSLKGDWDLDRLKENVAEIMQARDREALVAEIGGLDKRIDAAVKSVAGETAQAEQEKKELAQEMRLQEKVNKLLRAALIEGNGSIQRGYFIILDRETGKEMVILFPKQVQTVRDWLVSEADDLPDKNLAEALERVALRSLPPESVEN